MLSKNAFNALLKTLEEPPSHVKFIFATTEIRKVPVTVLSRCQRFDLQRLTIENLLELFHKIIKAEKLKAEEEALHIIAKAADGSARDGLSLLDQGISLGSGSVKTDIVKHMIGLADRGQTFDLYEALIKGEVEKVIRLLSEQYKNGANPVTLLQDLINITHMLAKVRIVPHSINDISVTENERAFCQRMNDAVSLAILSKIWQMLIKGLQELNVAPVQIDALEMILIRIAYSAHMPTPLELLDGLKKNSEQVVVERVPTPVKEPEVKVAGVALNSVDDLVSHLEKAKQPLMVYSLKNDISFMEFSNGFMKVTLSKKIQPDFIMNLHKILHEATGLQWKIETVNGALGETIADKEKASKEEDKRNISEYPLVRAILDEFKGAKFETLTRKVKETATEDNNAEIFFEGND
jgi:DNA polymerase-3 subunit gamma/tau